MSEEEKPKPRYRLYCPNHFSNRRDDGFDEFLDKNFHSENNVIEQLVRYAMLMKWYQIVDTRNNFKVVREQAPKIEL